MQLKIAPIEIEKLGKTNAALIVDAIFGTGLSRPPREPFSQIVEAVKSSKKPLLAIDLPSGLDCDTGGPLGDMHRSNAHDHFRCRKDWLRHPEARRYLGEVTIGDIGCPRELIDE